MSWGGDRFVLTYSPVWTGNIDGDSTRTRASRANPRSGERVGATFDALPTFATAKEAIAHAKQFAEAWLEQKA
ncbi:hypothetical protein BSU04_20655 [Caballeronia sordidicola]|uniref:Uncharacterized protein n=1 Tax=Caballeronia sordidicola TaxID=196367 RepID=A0A226X020_CABSO|nr:hypothetical protein BSU04_20655 [Caballeronia sordidicola]